MDAPGFQNFTETNLFDRHENLDSQLTTSLLQQLEGIVQHRDAVCTP